MITLSILTDLCQYWWLWWLLPFLLGLLLGWAIWANWRKKYEDLEATIAGYKRNISELEAKLEDCMAKRSEIESDLALERGRIRELEMQLKAKAAVSAAPAVAAAGIAAMPKATPKPEPKPEPRVAPQAAAPASNKYAKLKEDNLQIVEGIGPKMNQLLIENGISSWSVLGSKSGSELKGILDKYGDKYRIIDPMDWPAQGKLAADGNWDGLIAHQKADGSDSKVEKMMIKMGIIKAWKENDLKAVEGIGPKIEGILNAAGITTWKGLSETSESRLKDILAAAGDRYKLADPGTWPKQAEYAANGQWDELTEYQDFLDGGKKPS